MERVVGASRLRFAMVLAALPWVSAPAGAGTPDSRVQVAAPGLVRAAAMPSVARRPSNERGVSSGEPSGNREGQTLRATRPSAFEENRGQAGASARFLSRSREGFLFLEDRGFTAVTAGGAAVHVAFQGATPEAALVPEGLRPGVVHVLRGRDESKWIRGARTFTSVRYAGIHPRTDLVFHRARGADEYDVVVAPGGDPTALRLAVSGASETRIDPTGALVAVVRGAEFRQSAPVAFLEGEPRTPVSARFVSHLDGTFGFEVGPYDRTRTLVIDPTFAWADYLGGSGSDSAYAIALDSAGNTIVVGLANSVVQNGPYDFPTTAGALQPAFAGGSSDAFVSKLSADGTTLLWSTYLGGTTALGAIGNDTANAVAVDDEGNVSIGGDTSSRDFPVTAGAYQTVATAANFAFVAQLDPTGSQLRYGSYFQPALAVRALAVDPSGAIHVTGNATGGLPVTPGAVDLTYSGSGSNAFYAVFAPHGQGAADLLYSSYLSGGVESFGYGIAVAPTGEACITGWTQAIQGKAAFPTTSTALRPAPVYAGPKDKATHWASFFTKIRPGTGGAGDLLYSTYVSAISTNDREVGFAVALDAGGRAYVVGRTRGDATQLPVTVNAFDATPNGSFSDSFLVVLDPAQSGTASLVYGTYLGGATVSEARAVGLDVTGRAQVVGFIAQRAAPPMGFPTTTGALQPTSQAPGVAGATDAYLSVFDLTAVGAQQLAYSTLFGGPKYDRAYGLACSPTGFTYVAGHTQSTAAQLPVPMGTYDATLGGTTDAFILKLAP